jgi:DNA-binding response OmpR family regulator
VPHGEFDSTWLPDVRAPRFADGTTAHALVIHSDRVLRGFLQIYLLGAGYVVSVGADGAEGTRDLGGRVPHLIVLDAGAAHLEGVQFVFETNDFIPLLFLTADEDVCERADQLGIPACHVSPLSESRFLEAAARCLALQRTRRFSALLN